MNIENKIKEKVPLAPLTTFKIGGLAKFFVEIDNQDELIAIKKWAEKNKQKIYILGGGSNILINDKGVDGLVVKINNKGIKIKGENIIVQAGEMLCNVVGLSIKNNLSGFEWASGIPGTIGGAVRGNAGAYGSETGNLVKQVIAFDLSNSNFVKFDKNACQFDYRHSFFKVNPNFIIWEVEFELKLSEPEKIIATATKYVKNRTCGQPKYPSAGCAFKNLFVHDLKQKCPHAYQEAIKYKLVKGQKVGCGYFIDQSGLKGKRVGQAMISQEHANFIVNLQDAKAEEVIELIKKVKKEIKAKYNIDLEEEVQYFGFN